MTLVSLNKNKTHPFTGNVSEKPTLAPLKKKKKRERASIFLSYKLLLLLAFHFVIVFHKNTKSTVRLSG